MMHRHILTETNNAIDDYMQNQAVDNVDEHVVKQAVIQAIRTCSSDGCLANKCSATHTS